MFVIGDIHGELKLLKRLYNKIKIYKEPIYQVGDIIDRGSYPLDCLNFIFEHNIFATMGNHELMFLDATDEENIYRRKDRSLWYNNGGFITHAQLKELPEEEYKKLRQKIKCLPYFIKTYDKDKTIIIMHAGMNRYPNTDFMENLYVDSGDFDFLWHRNSYLGSKDFQDLKDIYLVTGHTPFNDIAFDGINRFIIDTGAFATGKLSAIRFKKGKIEKHQFSLTDGYSIESIRR